MSSPSPRSPAPVAPRFHFSPASPYSRPSERRHSIAASTPSSFILNSPTIQPDNDRVHLSFLSPASNSSLSSPDSDPSASAAVHSQPQRRLRPSHSRSSSLSLLSSTPIAAHTSGSAPRHLAVSSPGVRSSVPAFSFPISPASDELTASQLIAAAFVSSPAAPLSPLSSRVFDRDDNSTSFCGPEGLDSHYLATPDSHSHSNSLNQSFSFTSGGASNAPNSGRHGRSASLQFRFSGSGAPSSGRLSLGDSHGLAPPGHRPSKSLVFGGSASGIQLQLPPPSERFKGVKPQYGDAAQESKDSAAHPVSGPAQSKLANLLGSPNRKLSLQFSRPRGSGSSMANSNRLSLTSLHHAPIEEEELQSPSIFHRVQSMLEYGTVFNKYSMNGRGKPTKKRVFYRPSQPGSAGSPGTLYWCDAKAGQLKEELKRSIPINEITDLYLGKQTTAFTGKFGQQAAEELCLSIVAKKRTLDLEAETTVEKQDFVDQLLALVRRLCRTQVAIHHNQAQQEKNSSAPPPLLASYSLPLSGAASSISTTAVHPGVQLNRSLSFSVSQSQFNPVSTSVAGPSTNPANPLSTPSVGQNSSNARPASPPPRRGSVTGSLAAFKPSTPGPSSSSAAVDQSSALNSIANPQTPIKSAGLASAAVAASNSSGLGTPQIARRLSLGAATAEALGADSSAPIATQKTPGRPSISVTSAPSSTLSSSNSLQSDPVSSLSALPAAGRQSPRNSLSLTSGSFHSQFGVNLLPSPSESTHSASLALSSNASSLTSNPFNLGFGHLYSLHLSVQASNLFPLTAQRLESAATLSYFDPISNQFQLLDATERISHVHSPQWTKEFIFPHLHGLNPMYCISVYDMQAGAGTVNSASISGQLPESPMKIPFSTSAPGQIAISSVPHLPVFPESQRIGSVYFQLDSLFQCSAAFPDVLPPLPLSLHHSTNLFHQIRLVECNSRVFIRLIQPPVPMTIDNGNAAQSSAAQAIVSEDGSAVLIPPPVAGLSSSGYSSHARTNSIGSAASAGLGSTTGAASAQLPSLHQLASNSPWLLISPTQRSQSPFLRSVFRSMNEAAPFYRSNPLNSDHSNVSSASSSVANSGNNSPTQGPRRLGGSFSLSQPQALGSLATLPSSAIPIGNPPFIRKRSSSTNINVNLLSNGVINNGNVNQMNPLGVLQPAAFPRKSSGIGARTLTGEQMKELARINAVPANELGIAGLMSSQAGQGSLTTQSGSDSADHPAADDSSRNELIKSVEDQIKLVAQGIKMRMKSISQQSK